MTISTKRGTLDLTNHMDQQYIESVLAFGSWYVDNGYIRHNCKSTKKKQHLHRVVYELAHGAIPEGLQIDHINGDRSNNFLSNLRVVTNQQNQWNRTTAKGYSRSKQHNKWKAKLSVNGEFKFLGLFDSEADARAAYLKAKTIYHQIPCQNALNQS